jgi:NAD(P)H-nitrite reductase large subunit
MNITIIGTGAAGRTALNEILRLDSSAEITITTHEPDAFYQRPFLADFIVAKSNLATLHAPSDEIESNPRINLMTETRVTDVIPDDNTIKFADGTTHQYNFLLIASGAAPELGNLQRFETKLTTLRSLTDAQYLKQELSQKRPQVLLFGGGYQSVELCRVLHSLAVPFTFLSTEKIFWPQEIYGLNAHDIKALLASRGIEVHTDESIRDIVNGDKSTYSVFTEKGRCIECDMIISAQGDRPNVDFLQSSSLKLDKGLLVNEQLRTNIANIYAAGDCAQVYDMNRDINRINFGWKSAAKQGVIAGQNIAGADKTFIPVKTDFYIDLLGKNYLERW